MHQSFQFRSMMIAASLTAALIVTGCSSSSTSSNEAKTDVKQAALKKSEPVKKSKSAPPQRKSEIDIDVKSNVTRTGEIYLLRGLANVFSRGMDVMGARMVRKGLDARVFNHAAWKSLSENIIARHKQKKVSFPIIIMGHSLGGNASAKMAKVLGDNGVPVSYVVAFDPTVTTHVGKNVREVINYYLPNEEHSNIIKKAPGFKGKLTNRKVTNMAGVTHMNVEKNVALQNRSISKAMALTKPLSKKRKKNRRTS